MPAANTTRRLGLVATIAGVSIMAAFLLQVVTARLGNPGLQQFTNYTFGGNT